MTGEDHDAAGDEDHDAAGESPSPGEVLRRHQARSRKTGREYLDGLAGAEEQWLRRMVTAMARAHDVDADDLFQDVAEGLLDCDVLELGRDGMHSWLARRTRWEAADLHRRKRRRPTPTESDELARLTEVPDARKPPQGPPIVDRWSVQRLVELGLNHDQAQVVLLVCWDTGLPLREYAELLGRKYATARKQKERGLDALRRHFGLDPEEDEAMIAHRRLGLAEAARAVGRSEAELLEIVRRATEKINKVFDSGKRRDSHED